MYLFVFVDFFEVILLKKKDLIAVKQLIEFGKFFTETFSFVMVFNRHFSRAIFFILLFLPGFLFFMSYRGLKFCVNTGYLHKKY